jgi:alkylhydroperoxidase family enzyme
MAFGMDERLALLVDIRASQLNGCAFCLFSAKERAALAWTEALTRLNDPEGVSDAAYAEVREQFSEEELAQLTFRVVAINGWNRLNVAFRNPPGSKDKLFGLEKAGLD